MIEAFFDALLKEVIMEKFTRDDAVCLLRSKYESLGRERYPCRSDFTDVEVMGIKAHLGPWPRALEAAGIKPPREDADQAARRILEKRIRAKRNRRG